MNCLLRLDIKSRHLFYQGLLLPRLPLYGFVLPLANLFANHARNKGYLAPGYAKKTFLKRC